GTAEMDGCVRTGGRLEGAASAPGGGPAAGPDGGARLTAAPGSGTAAGGIGGGRSPNSCALAGAATKASKNAATASGGQAPPPRRNRKMPSPPVLMTLLFTENAANSSLGPIRCPHQRQFMEPGRSRGIGR